MVVDDEVQVRSLLAMIMNSAGYEATEIADGHALRAAFDGSAPDVVLLDLKLPDSDGLDLLPAIKKQWPETEVIMLTGHASVDAAVSAMKLGAYDFQPKPFDPKALVITVDRALEHKRLKEEANSLRQALSTMSGGMSPIFKSPAIKEVVRTVEKVAPSDVSILVTGESGTGKEVIVDLIHALSPGSKGPLIKINCAALPRELIEGELFGSVKGAFTGANSDREGLFRKAAGGTLLLDEISEMPVDTQSKLLRVLQEKEVRPVGGYNTYKISCRIIAATNRHVEDAIREGKLRQDLYYRISTVTIPIPPLRERREDILPLARSFLGRYAAQAGCVVTGFTREAEERLHEFDWPGNVRQLQNVIQRAVLITEGKEVGIQELAISVEPSEPEEANLTLMEDVERNAIVQMLKETGGNKLKAAKRLGIGRQTLYNKIKTYGIATD